MIPRYQPLTALDQARFDLASTGTVDAKWSEHAERYEIPEMELYSKDGNSWAEFDEPDGTYNYADTTEFNSLTIRLVGGPRDGTLVS